MTTVHPGTDMSTPEHEAALAQVEEIAGQLRHAGLVTSEEAVLVLALHAHRHQLSYDQVVLILAQFTSRSWRPGAQHRAGELLADIGAPISPASLELDVDEARLAAGRGDHVGTERPCDNPECRECWLPLGDLGPYAPGVDAEQWFAANRQTSAREPEPADDLPWKVLPSGDVDFSAMVEQAEERDQDPCSKDWPGRPSCLHVMAEGGIHPDELCGACTRRFMAALDAAVPNLSWHQNYRRRAADDTA